MVNLVGLWIIAMLFTGILGIVGGALMGIMGIKHRKISILIPGFLNFVMIAMPIWSVGTGIDLEKYVKIPSPYYWSIFAFLGFLAMLRGIKYKIHSVGITGVLICTITVLQIGLGLYSHAF